MGKILDGIKSPNDLKNLNNVELKQLSEEIRQVLVCAVSQNGGHLASNLGVVELTVAIHKCFRSPRDQIIFDVGHQSYTHKILTGRKDEFSTLRTENGISGFTRPGESEHDVFFSGHSSTAVSASLGLALAKKLKNEKGHVVAVVGDGSFTGGMAYEGLNNAGRSNSKLIVILNDNKMSISKNVGSFAKYLAVIRSKPRYAKLKSKAEFVIDKIPLIGEPLARFIFKIKTKIKNSMYGSTMFEDMGFRYMGPIDGHNFEQLCDALNTAKLINSPVLLHVKTVKGKGYDLAEHNPSEFHGISKFDINTGEPLSSSDNFSNVFGRYLCEVAANDKRICAVSAAMLIGTGLSEFSSAYPDRFFDVGIAEQHAVTFSSGLAKNGMLPVFAVYSTFLQRCYDQLIHDGALQGVHMILAIDRAGFVGEDGETHQGLFDVPFLNTIPDITVFCPSDFSELKNSLNSAFYHCDGVVAVRYPRGNEEKLPEDFNSDFENYEVYGKRNAENYIVTYGRIVHNAVKAKKILEKSDIDVSLLKINRIKPLDDDIFNELKNAKNVFFFEEGMLHGGTGEVFANKLFENEIKCNYRITAVSDSFVKQASVDSQLRKYKLDAEGMAKEVSHHLV